MVLPGRRQPATKQEATSPTSHEDGTVALEEGSVPTVEPGHPDGLEEHSKEDGSASCEVVQQCEDIDAALDERGCLLNCGCSHALPTEASLTKALFPKNKPSLQIQFTDALPFTLYKV